MIAGLSPELQLLAALVHDALVPGAAVERQPPGASLDWDMLLRTAIRAGLAPAVYAGLARAKLQPPDSVASRLRASYLAGRVRTQALMEPHLRRALAALHGRGLKPVVLKGADLAYTAYPEPALRPMGDVDLLVPADSLDSARDALQATGFRTRPEGPAVSHHLDVYYSPDGWIGVELHHHLLPPKGPYQLSVESMIAQSREAGVAGMRARVLAPADALHHVCVHVAFSHRYAWFPMRALADILAITVSAGGDLDWDLLVDSARAARTAGAVYWPLRLSQEWLQAPVPPGVLSRLAPPRAVRRLVSTLAETGYLLGGGPDADHSSTVLYRKLMEFSLYAGCRPASQIQALWGLLFPPPRDVGHLPPEVVHSRLRYAAHLGRPARLVRGLFALSRLAARKDTPKAHRREL